MNRFLSILLMLNFIATPVFAANYLDFSVDEDIRKNYNPNQLEMDVGLPPLPQITDYDRDLNNANNVNIDKSYQKTFNSSVKYRKDISDSAQVSYARLKKGKKIKLKTLSTITDGMKKGTKLTFVSTYPVTTTYFTIPGGTIFTGEIIDSHRPQFTGNGGLIEIRINAMEFNNEVLPLLANVKKVSSYYDSKFIYLNNIKGKRKYISNMISSTAPGTRFCKKMYGAGSRFWQKGGVDMLIAPLPVVVGSAVWAGNVLVSPAIAAFSRGDSIKLPKGSVLEVKLREDMYIYK